MKNREVFIVSRRKQSGFYGFRNNFIEKELGVSVDPVAISIFDEEHSEQEERWVSLGKDRSGSVLILIHTFLEVSAGECRIRIISARKANKRETRQYEEI